jgi:hypothetical protein
MRPNSFCSSSGSQSGGYARQVNVVPRGHVSMDVISDRRDRARTYETLNDGPWSRDHRPLPSIEAKRQLHCLAGMKGSTIVRERNHERVGDRIGRRVVSVTLDEAITVLGRWSVLRRRVHSGGEQKGEDEADSARAHPIGLSADSRRTASIAARDCIDLPTNTPDTLVLRPVARGQALQQSPPAGPRTRCAVRGAVRTTAQGHAPRRRINLLARTHVKASRSKRRPGAVLTEVDLCAEPFRQP